MQSSRETDPDGRGVTQAARAEQAAQAQAADPDPPRAAEPHDSEELSAELARIEDRYRRALADLDNYRKRSARELERRLAEAQESVLRDWLDVVDSVERAMQMEADGPCREGLEAVLAQIDGVLRRHGVERVGAPGERFDPERHEAVATRAAEGAHEQTILDVHRSGYASSERVIRPAQVVVARAGEPAR